MEGVSVAVRCAGGGRWPDTSEGRVVWSSKPCGAEVRPALSRVDLVLEDIGNSCPECGGQIQVEQKCGCGCPSDIHSLPDDGCINHPECKGRPKSGSRCSECKDRKWQCRTCYEVDEEQRRAMSRGPVTL